MVYETERPAWRRVLAGTLYVGLLVLCLGAGSVFGLTGQSKVLSEVVSMTIRNERPAEVFRDDAGRPGSSVTILVLGCDVDYDNRRQIVKKNARSDMMLVTRLDFERNRITGISIPRDLIVEVPGYRPEKINAFNAIGGPELATAAAEEVLDIRIDRTVVIDFDAFQAMVDLLGGVEVFVPRRMKYDDNWGDLHIDLRPGRQVLDGYQAMGYVRYRHGDSDFKRQERQKEFMMAFKERLMERWDRLGAVADKAVELSGNALNAREVAAIALFARGVGADNVKLGMVPVTEGHGSALFVDRVKLWETMNELNMYGRRNGGSYTMR